MVNSRKCPLRITPFIVSRHMSNIRSASPRNIATFRYKIGVYISHPYPLHAYASVSATCRQSISRMIKSTCFIQPPEFLLYILLPPCQFLPCSLDETYIPDKSLIRFRQNQRYFVFGYIPPVRFRSDNLTNLTFLFDIDGSRPFICIGLVMFCPTQS